MSFDPNITVRAAATKPMPRPPNTRATLRDLNSSREIQVFRRPSVLRRVLEVILRSRGGDK